MGLHTLIKASNISKIREHLTKKPNSINKIAKRHWEHNTPLITALEYSNVKTVKLLLDYGANPNIYAGLSSLHCSLMFTSEYPVEWVLKGYVVPDRSKVKLLLEYGANPNIQNPLKHYVPAQRDAVLTLLEYDAFYNGKKRYIVTLSNKIKLLNIKN